MLFLNQPMTKKEFEKELQKRLLSEFNTDLNSATEDELYRGLARLTRSMLSDQRKQFMSHTYGANRKQVYYLCMEFLMGRSLKTTLYNLGLAETAREVLAGYDVKLENLYNQEPDAGLGNGGLGRLAACYLDGMATTEIPGTGYSILYEYGIFKQEIVDGWQQELADDWLPGGSVWLKRHPEATIDIKFDGEVEEAWNGDHHYITHKNFTLVKAVPSDMYVSGYDSEGVSQLRLWEAKAPGFDMGAFNAGEYSHALSQNANAELISKVLYPNDNHTEGKILRLKQQYFLSAASIGDIVQRHLAQYGGMDSFPDKVAIHINDTHPTLAIPELMRILLDECGYNWEAAEDICRRTFAYTNHTVMSEALEKWPEDIFCHVLPRIHSIIVEMDRRARINLEEAFPGDEGKVEWMALVSNGEIRMANICCYIAHTINGVSKLHSEIIKQTVFHDYYLYTPEKFTNVTNGIAYRRWLLQSNPRLTELIEDTIGPGFKKDASELEKLRKKDTKKVLKQLAEVKHANKVDFANHYSRLHPERPPINPDSIFDCQVKRMHEYKRQHLNALNIAGHYLELKANPNMDFVPKTYIFAAKAAPGYYFAKQMIRLIVKLGDLIEEDAKIREKLRVIYLEDYNVTTSEILMPASEVSEQISLAGTEASGTGNMKFMLNGAVTLGTYDGANIEIAEAAGAENFIQFGMLSEEAEALKASGYHPNSYIQNNPLAKEVLRFLEHGWNGENFQEIANNLQTLDPYMVMADFNDYRRAEAELGEIYRDSEKFSRMSLMNIAGSGIFSADRSVRDYANNIWNIPLTKTAAGVKIK